MLHKFRVRSQLRDIEKPEVVGYDVGEPLDRSII